ncbi:MAG: exonuclease SbcC [Crenarchaeota archaeon]|nr:MAG: exonuclease SbcC [Thermoproteota archaeon]RDJ34011.1 MAG: exonuclease SbcC [Thermoproteota archaeon]RDJ36874.1 MAG: exonuclease SbcC [Thermoproteota archaeon]RDJ37591.1 MAG: exonuclease SbcC [Thermoproteota archaeon]
MVFGWGKKKSENQVKVEPKQQQIIIEQIPSIVDDIKEIRRKTLIAEINNFGAKINPNLEELIKIAKELEKDDLNVDDIDKHLKVLVVRGKKLVISTIKNEANKKFSKIDSYDDAVALGNDVSHALKKMGDVLGRQSRVIHIFAKKYADKLKNILSVLNSDNSEIQTILQNFTQIDSSRNDILDYIKQLDEEKSLIEEKKHRISELSETLLQTKKSHEEVDNNIKQLRSSSEYKKYLDINAKIDEFKITKHDIKNEIDLQFTKISRPLGKYQYVSSLDKDKRNLLEKLLHDPFDVLTSENKSALIEIIQSVRKAVVSESISVKDVQKSLTYLDETTEMLDGYIKQIFEYNAKLNDLESTLDVFDSKKLKDQEHALQKHVENIEDLESRISSLESEVKELNDSRPRIISQIQQRLDGISAIRYSITSE